MNFSTIANGCIAVECYMATVPLKIIVYDLYASLTPISFAPSVPGLLNPWLLEVRNVTANQPLGGIRSPLPCPINPSSRKPPT